MTITRRAANLPLWTLLGAVIALLTLLVPAPAVAGEALPTDLRIWPNAQSRANSDAWLAERHDLLLQMRPRILVLNFANGLAPAKGLALVDSIIAALRESSRYHGWEDKSAAPFLECEVAKYVDLQDAAPPSDPLDGNSTRYPRVPGWTSGINFQYRRLFEADFAAHYGYPDPDNPGRFLPLVALVERGLVHEVWFLAYQRKHGAPFESVEVKQAWDAGFRKIPGRSVQAGNGGDPAQPFIGRSLRIGFINAERGPGCFLESLAHSYEGTAHANAIPYFRRYFYEYAGFDLDKRIGLPFGTFYAVDARGRPQFLAYPDPTTLQWHHGDREGTLTGYVPVGGNVHFPPNARGHYDKSNPAPVQFTGEHWRWRDGEGGKDRVTTFTVKRCVEPYEPIAGDCMGAWLVYWRQNMPGVNCPGRDDDGKPLKNWWPFLYY